MKRIIKLNLILIISLISTLFGQHNVEKEINFTGIYKGKNIYIQNPLKIDKSCFCTNQVYINKELILNNPQTSAYEIDLSFLHVGDLVLITIKHDYTCLPKIINPSVMDSLKSVHHLNDTINKTNSNNSLINFN